MAAYYNCIQREQQADNVSIAHYKPTQHAQGAWNQHEQHMAAATGVLTHELSQFAPQANMRIARISLDILGLIPLDDFIITTRCIRPGKTIELIESVMSSGGRACITARAWRLLTQDTSAIAGLEDQNAPQHPDELPVWEEMKSWPGGFVKSVQLVANKERRAAQQARGRHRPRSSSPPATPPTSTTPSPATPPSASAWVSKARWCCAC